MVFFFKNIILGQSSQSGLSLGADRDGRSQVKKPRLVSPFSL